MTKWTKEDKEWLGYRRKMSVQNKDKISLSQPPWENREANATCINNNINKKLGETTCL